MQSAFKYLLLLVVAALPVAFMLVMPSSDGPVEVDSGASTSEVIRYSKQIILQSVRSPQTATFPSNDQFLVEPVGINQWRVEAYVNVDTAVGKQVRMPWAIEIKKNGSRWTQVEREHMKSPLTKAVSEGSWTSRLEKK